MFYVENFSCKCKGHEVIFTGNLFFDEFKERFEKTLTCSAAMFLVVCCFLLQHIYIICIKTVVNHPPVFKGCK